MLLKWFLDSSFSGLLSVIVKWGDDLRQELLCSQLLEQFRVSERVVLAAHLAHRMLSHSAWQDIVG